MCKQNGNVMCCYVKCERNQAKSLANPKIQHCCVRVRSFVKWILLKHTHIQMHMDMEYSSSGKFCFVFSKSSESCSVQRSAENFCGKWNELSFLYAHIITVAGGLNLEYPGHEAQMFGAWGADKGSQKDLCNKFLCDGNIMSMRAYAFEFVTHIARQLLMGVLYPVCN